MSGGQISVRPIIGLEIHVQLATRTKMFCRCPVEFGAEPNTRVCAVCLGLPGALPVMNRRAFELAVRAGIVADSVPETEFEETRSKLAALTKAIELAEEGF